MIRTVTAQVFLEPAARGGNLPALPRARDECGGSLDVDTKTRAGYGDRPAEFEKHYYPRVGDFDSGEETECAHWLDRAAQAGKIDFWGRNLQRKPCALSFQTSKDRFYPDFVCRLPDGRTLVVESKGADRWNEAEEDRKIGELWAELSGGSCLFVMVKEKRWDWIDAKLGI